MAASWTHVHQPRAQLRGSRDYVHSTDIYTELLAGAASAGLAVSGPLDLRIRSRITRQPSYCYGPPGPTGACAASLNFSAGSAVWMAVVTEAGDTVTARRPYDETPAASYATVEGRMATLRGPTGLQPIEALTALAVHLHKSALVPPPSQRWMLGQLTISRPLEEGDATHLDIEIERLIGATMTRTRIAAQDGVLGSMLFVLAGGGR